MNKMAGISIDQLQSEFECFNVEIDDLVRILPCRIVYFPLATINLHKPNSRLNRTALSGDRYT